MRVERDTRSRRQAHALLDVRHQGRGGSRRVDTAAARKEFRALGTWARGDTEITRYFPGLEYAVICIASAVPFRDLTSSAT